MCTPTASRTYRVTVRSAGGCERVDSIRVDLLPPQRVRVSAPGTLEVLVGQPFTIPLAVSGIAGQRITVHAVPEADLRFAPPFDAPYEHVLGTSAETLTMEAMAFLGRDTLRSYRVSVTSSGACLLPDTTVGVIDADACGLPLRAVRISAPAPRITAGDHGLRIECAGPFTVRIIGLRGETLHHTTGTDLLTLPPLQGASTSPVFVVVSSSSGGVATVMSIIGR
jgi:hypothetical protein